MEVTVVGIRFKKAGKIYYFSPLEIEYHNDDRVVVETARGLELGTVVIKNRNIKEEEIVSTLKPVLRLANEEDIAVYNENQDLAKSAGEVFLKKSVEYNLDMTLVNTEYTLDRNKLIFYFIAEDRIDFRELVKDLASIFRTRIELRQIGIRDEAKNLGGIGCCGRKLCCSTWLGDFQSVSIKMAKDQNLSLNPTKISGVCGRLCCCLNFEHKNYEEALAILPNVGSIVKTNDGNGKITDVFVLNEEVSVQLDGKNGITTIKKYKVNEIKVLKTARKNNERIDRELERELRELED